MRNFDMLVVSTVMYFSKTGTYKDVRECFCSVKEKRGIVERHKQVVI